MPIEKMAYQFARCDGTTGNVFAPECATPSPGVFEGANEPLEVVLAKAGWVTKTAGRTTKAYCPGHREQAK